MHISRILYFWENVWKVTEVGINTPEFYVYCQEQKAEELREKYKDRASYEGKNGEMKQFHGLDRAKGYGLRSMSFQAKLTALAVNLKWITKLLSSKSLKKHHFIYIFLNPTKFVMCQIFIPNMATSHEEYPLFQQSRKRQALTLNKLQIILEFIRISFMQWPMQNRSSI